mgnify:CR=1 FL=1
MQNDVTDTAFIVKDLDVEDLYGYFLEGIKIHRLMHLKRITDSIDLT